MRVTGSIERDGKLVVESAQVNLVEKPGLIRGWRGSFALDLRKDPDAGDWVTQIKPDPNDPGCQLTLADGRTGTFHIERHVRRARFMDVEFVGTGALELAGGPEEGVVRPQSVVDPTSKKSRPRRDKKHPPAGVYRNNVAELRERSGLSRMALATAAGLAAETIRRVEKGSSMRIGTARKLVEALGRDWDSGRNEVFPHGWSGQQVPPATLRLIVDHGTAPPEEIAALMADIAFLYRLLGGSGIIFKADEVHAFELASQ